MMGFYPVVPGVPVYELGSPVFARVRVRLSNGETLNLACRHTSRKNKYIQSVRANGQKQSRVWFTHADVLKGLKLELEMSDTPNTALGHDPGDFPPSRMDLNPGTFGD